MDAATSLAETTEVRQCMESWTAAVRALDMDGIMSHYADDVVAFLTYEQARQDTFRGIPVHIGYRDSMFSGPLRLAA